MSGLNWIYQWYHMITVYRCAATGTDTDYRFLRRKKAGQIRLPRCSLSIKSFFMIRHCRAVARMK